ncbi:hypothetical protein NMG60_11037041 [Bertholletia excelsa]
MADEESSASSSDPAELLEAALGDPAELLEAASDFAHHPGAHSDAAVKEFLDRFPLPVIIYALQTKGDVPGLEDTLVACLERIFRTKHGASLIPHHMPFVVVGLEAFSQKVRCIACKTVSCLLENFDETNVSATQLLVEYDVYPLLFKCLIYGDEEVAAAAMDAIRKFATSAGGLAVIFPSNADKATHLCNLSKRCSSLGRIRILALLVKLFSASKAVACMIYKSNLLIQMEARLSHMNDMLETLSVLELFYELAEVEHSTEFLSRTQFLQRLGSLISNASVEPILRARAMMIAGRLMSKANVFMFVDESSVKALISAIDGTLGCSENQDADESECALEALGQIGTTIQGATLVLISQPPAARHVIHFAFDRHGRGKQLAALHALGNIVGETRSENDRMLNVDAEESLRLLIYETASRSPKLTPSGLFLSVLQQESEFRIAVYRLMTGLVARPWCLTEICSRQEIISIVADTFTETAKIGMEARHSCCQAILKALSLSPKLASDPSISGLAAKLDEAVKRGPYLARRHPEAQPAVMTAERF